MHFVEHVRQLQRQDVAVHRNQVDVQSADLHLAQHAWGGPASQMDMFNIEQDV